MVMYTILYACNIIKYIRYLLARNSNKLSVCKCKWLCKQKKKKNCIVTIDYIFVVKCKIRYLKNDISNFSNDFKGSFLEWK